MEYDLWLRARIPMSIYSPEDLLLRSVVDGVTWDASIASITSAVKDSLPVKSDKKPTDKRKRSETSSSFSKLPPNKFGTHIVGPKVPRHNGRSVCVPFGLDKCEEGKSCKYSHDHKLTEEELKACISDTKPERYYGRDKK